MATNARRFAAIMRDLARVPAQAATASARDIGRQIKRDMDASRDPFGRAWKNKADGSRSTLRKTGKGRRSIVVSAMSGAGIKITVGILYMIYHQFGGASHLRGPGGSFRQRRKNKDFGRDKDRSRGRGNPPRRSFLPQGDEVPRTWAEIVLANVEEAARKVLARA